MKCENLVTDQLLSEQLPRRRNLDDLLRKLLNGIARPGRTPGAAVGKRLQRMKFLRLVRRADAYCK
jgi:hypothetical protein